MVKIRLTEIPWDIPSPKIVIRTAYKVAGQNNSPRGQKGIENEFSSSGLLIFHGWAFMQSFKTNPLIRLSQFYQTINLLPSQLLNVFMVSETDRENNRLDIKVKMT
jgi:hypothetical protein